MISRVQRRHGRDGADAGFTIVELLIYLVVAAVVFGGLFQLLVGQNILYSKQRELTDVRTSLRGAASLLAWELRQVSPVDGDLYAIGTNSVDLRSVRGSGLVCGIHSGLHRFGVWRRNGEFQAAAEDSALIFKAGAAAPNDDRWISTKVMSLWTPSGGGVASCNWSGVSASPELVVELRDVTGKVKKAPGPLDSVTVGAPVRMYRRTSYALYQEVDGRWWLGRRVGPSTGTYEPLTGPLRAPADSGLVFRWLDANGNPTANRTLVREVEITIRAQSQNLARRGAGQAAKSQEETLRIRVSVRS